MEKECVWSCMGNIDGVEFRHAQYFIKDDGGRSNAGYKGDTGDCVVRAIAIATEIDYKTVYDELFELSGKTPRNGVKRKVYEKYLLSKGFKWVSCMQIGSGCRVHLSGRELPAGRLVCRLSKHLTAMVDGVIHDTFDPSRSGQRCVYGYFIKKT